MRVATIPNRYNHKTCDNQGQRNAVFFFVSKCYDHKIYRHKIMKELNFSVSYI